LAGEIRGKEDHAGDEPQEQAAEHLTSEQPHPFDERGAWREEGGSVGATSIASSAASATRICTGTLSIVKIGRIARKAPARTNTSIQLFQSQSMRLVGHLGHLLDDSGGELDELANHPGRKQEQQPQHTERLRHKTQGLFIDRSHRLKQAHD